MYPPNATESTNTCVKCNTNINLDPLSEDKDFSEVPTFS